MYSAKLYDFVLIIPKVLHSGLFQKGYLQNTSPKYTFAPSSPKCFRLKALFSQISFGYAVFYMLYSHIHNSYHKLKTIKSFSEETCLILDSLSNLFDKETFTELHL